MPKRQTRPTQTASFSSIEDLVADQACLGICLFGSLKGVKQNTFKSAILQQHPEFVCQELKKIPHLKFGYIYFAVSAFLPAQHN